MHGIDYFLFIHFFMFDVGNTYDDSNSILLGKPSIVYLTDLLDKSYF